MKLPVHPKDNFKQVIVPMNCLAHQFVVDFTDNFAEAGKCGLFSLSTHLKSLIICKFSNFLRTSTNFLHNCSCHS